MSTNQWIFFLFMLLLGGIVGLVLYYIDVLHQAGVL